MFLVSFSNFYAAAAILHALGGHSEDGEGQKVQRRGFNEFRPIDETRADLAGETPDPLTSLDCYDTLRELLLTLGGIVIAFTLIISLVKTAGL